jgi:DNA-binding transcriptional LysR family regulator
VNWDDIRIFLAIARSGQLLAASRRLEINHATVGRRLTALETALKTTLVTRKPNGCELTNEGEAFLAAAEAMEAEMISAQATLGRQDSAVSGTVRIGAPDGFGVWFLAPRLQPLLARHPGLKLQLVPVPRSFSLSRREADIAITVEQPSEGRLISRKLTDYSLGLYGSSAYFDDHPCPRSVEDLRGHRLIGYVDDLIYSPKLTYAGDLFGSAETSFEISSAIGQYHAVRSGTGIGILHDYVAQNDEGLRLVLPDRQVTRSYWIVHHESVRGLARVRAVLDHIAGLIAQERDIFERLQR